MRVDQAELCLLRQEFEQLKNHSFFTQSGSALVNNICAYCDQVLAQPDNHHFKEIAFFWELLVFLRGTIKNEVPYEIVQALELVLAEWGMSDWAILTAYTHERNYYFKKSPQGKHLLADSPIADLKIARLALPRLYKHFYLYSAALYHEVGHFIDDSNGLSISLSIFNEQNICQKQRCPTDVVFDAYDRTISHNHLREYIADIFAASYTGNALINLFELGFGKQPASNTHPSFDERKQNIEDFLNDRPNKLVDSIKSVFTAALNKNITPRTSAAPSVDTCFADCRPPNLQQQNDIHGILESAWEYVRNIPDLDSGQDSMNKFRHINDLTEKSVRNFFIMEKWETVHGTSQ